MDKIVHNVVRNVRKLIPKTNTEELNFYAKVHFYLYNIPFYLKKNIIFQHYNCILKYSNFSQDC